MTSSLKVLILAASMLVGSAYAQEKFLAICEKPEPVMALEMKSLRNSFKVTTCKQIAEKISQLQSYNEFFNFFQAAQPVYANSWMNALPHLLGNKRKQGFAPRGTTGIGLNLTGENIFARPEVYSEFKNLKVLDLTADSYKKSACELLKDLPHIEIVLTDMFTINRLKECKPYSKLPDIIILRDFLLNNDLEDGIRRKIIGIEHFVNFSRDLISLPRLRYLGVSYPFKDSEYQFLVQNQNITHLSLNSSANLSNAVVLGELPNLSFLALSCYKNPRQEALSYMASDSPDYCDNANLKNVKFMKNLTYLNEVILDWEGLEDISTLDSLPNLKTRSHPLVP